MVRWQRCGTVREETGVSRNQVPLYLYRSRFGEIEQLRFSALPAAWLGSWAMLRHANDSPEGKPPSRVANKILEKIVQTYTWRTSGCL